MILKGLGQTLPDSLEYLDLKFTIDPNDLKIFWIIVNMLLD